MAKEFLVTEVLGNRRRGCVEVQGAGCLALRGSQELIHRPNFPRGELIGGVCECRDVGSRSTVAVWEKLECWELSDLVTIRARYLGER